MTKNPLRSRPTEWLVTAPSFLWLLLFFAIPAVIVLAFTFHGHTANGGVGDTNSRDNVRTDTHLRAAAGTVYIGRWGEGVVPGSGTVCVFNSQRPSLAATRLPGDLAENGAAELRDAALSLQAGGFVQLTAPTSVRVVSFRSSDCGFDLNGNPITAGSFVSGDGRERLETPGAHYNNDDPALGPILFSGGAAIVQPYFAPAL